MTNVDAEGLSWVRIVLAVASVAGLLALFGFALKHLKLRGFSMTGPVTGSRRLQVLESLPLDPRRRLVIIRRDAREHLLLLGINEDIVIETNLDKTPGSLQTKSGA
jgi:flagellar protein FliO/FliZ